MACENRSERTAAGEDIKLFEPAVERKKKLGIRKQMPRPLVYDQSRDANNTIAKTLQQNAVNAPWGIPTDCV